VLFIYYSMIVVCMSEYKIICKRCGKPIHNELYIEMVGDKVGPWHQYDCLKNAGWRRRHLRRFHFREAFNTKLIVPQGFWWYYRDDLEKFLKTPRSVLMSFIIPVVGIMVAFISPWAFALLILPFLYSLYPAYRISTSKTPPFWFP
jgi:hypothetical protein